MIWCYWIVWGQHWLSILPLVLFLLSTTAFKIIFLYQDYMKINYEEYIIMLIIYCIITVVQAGSQANGIKAYYHIIEVFVESSALYSICLILNIAFSSHNSVLWGYFDLLGTITRGIALTLLVGHVAAGHAHPDDFWQRSVISGSLHFGTHSGGQTSQQDSIISIDLESQQEIDNDHGYQNPASSEEDSAYNSGIQEDDLEVAQQERDIIYSHHTLAESQTDVSINSGDVIQKHGPELEQERETETEMKNMAIVC
ncbi:uncharacterized protein BT62DRAFT_919301 [Guyanagaster necrorhizus]|uniref:Uncharacterized protein n=1 Tax=Guyanagaster necrorhizus TaxID=856835 RepID=A0A9P7VVE8_9AGAR|nr:uncharacterized protein BT62DRAFT_919301 [Guyanagaster necrorhizus MCA 3950]KAG7447415.1 hypothetical protein BT62DRAFT_919301 [Guyanagaster necrorhizus MCA 3950]